MGKRKVPDLYRAPFPLYAIKVDPQTGLVMVAGGGGASKTGIKNAVHFLDLQLVGERQFGATLIHAHDTETRANMNMAVANGVMAVGQDGTCCLMKFTRRTQASQGARAAASDGDARQGNVRRRTAKKDKVTKEDDGSDMKEESADMSVSSLAELESDKNPQDPLQKVVRFSPDLSLLLTGGTDGHVRVWEFPSLKKKWDFKAHEGEVEDLDVGPGNKHVVTVGRDSACSVWTGDQLAMTLDWRQTVASDVAAKSYRHAACRFGKVEDQKDAMRLYTVQVPHRRDRRPPPCYLTKWDAKSFLPMLTAPCGSEVMSSLAVSDSGTFLGLGTVTGSIAIFIAFSLQRLYYVRESHAIVVTDLCFLPDAPTAGRHLKGDHEAALLSVAVDSRVQLHALANTSSAPLWLLLLLCGVMVVAAILLLQHLFPGFI